jgi:flagellin-specific chaperone FliS
MRAYRNSATESATHLDVLLACYDGLAEEIRMAGEAAAKSDLATRCRHSQRALLLIGHLESWISLLDDSDLTGSLASFYEYLRTEILRLQFAGGIDKFMDLALVVGETRAAWQKKWSIDLSRPEAGEEAAPPIGEPDGATPHFLGSA